MRTKTSVDIFTLFLAFVVTTTQAFSYSASAADQTLAGGEKSCGATFGVEPFAGTGVPKEKPGKAVRAIPFHTDVQYIHGKIVADPLILRDYLAEQNMPYDNGIKPPPLSKEEEAVVFENVVAMLNNSPLRPAANDIDKGKSLFLGVDVGDALENDPSGRTSPQTINLEFVLTEAGKNGLNYIIGDPTLSDRSRQNGGKGLKLANNILTPDGSLILTDVYWANYIDRTNVVPRHVHTEVLTKDQLPPSGVIERTITVPIMMGQRLSIAIRDEARTIGSVKHDLLRQHYANAKTGTLRHAYRFMSHGHKVFISMPLKFSMKAFRTFAWDIVRVAFVSTIMTTLSARNHPVTVNDVGQTIVQQSERLGHINQHAPKQEKGKSTVESFVAPDDQASLTKLVDPEELKTLFKIATPQTPVAHQKAHDANKDYEQERRSLEPELSIPTSTQYYIPIVGSTDRTIQLDVMPDLSAPGKGKILVSKFSLKGMRTSYFIVKQVDAPKTYAKLIKATGRIEAEAEPPQ